MISSTGLFPPHSITNALQLYRIAKRYQPYESQPTRCRNGQWTIGYGHRTDRVVRQFVDEAEADFILDADIETAARNVRAALTARVGLRCLHALVSWALATSPETVARSPVIHAVNCGHSNALKLFAVEEIGCIGSILTERMRRVEEMVLWRDGGPPDQLGRTADRAPN